MIANATEYLQICANIWDETSRYAPKIGISSRTALRWSHDGAIKGYRAPKRPADVKRQPMRLSPFLAGPHVSHSRTGCSRFPHRMHEAEWSPVHRIFSPSISVGLMACPYARLYTSALAFAVPALMASPLSALAAACREMFASDASL